MNFDLNLGQLPPGRISVCKPWHKQGEIRGMEYCAVFAGILCEKIKQLSKSRMRTQVDSVAFSLIQMIIDE